MLPSIIGIIATKQSIASFEDSELSLEHIASLHGLLCEASIFPDRDATRWHTHCEPGVTSQFPVACRGT